jgi:hypothetical protein
MTVENQSRHVENGARAGQMAFSKTVFCQAPGTSLRGFADARYFADAVSTSPRRYLHRALIISGRNPTDKTNSAPRFSGGFRWYFQKAIGLRYGVSL